MSEKLAVPSVDQLIAIRVLRKVTGQDLAGWLVDESATFRQVPVLPEHPGLAVIALREPGGCSPCFFCMVGHPFGMTSSVFNCCRRAAVSTAFLVKHLELCCLNYFDDRFGVTLPSLATEEKDMVLRVCFCLGVKVSDKTFARQVINILGVAFDFSTGLRKSVAMTCWYSWEASCLQTSFIQELRVTSRAAMVVHTLHRSPTGSTRAVPTSASPPS